MAWNKQTYYYTEGRRDLWAIKKEKKAKRKWRLNHTLELASKDFKIIVKVGIKKLNWKNDQKAEKFTEELEPIANN